MKNRIILSAALLLFFAGNIFPQLSTKSSRAANHYYTARELYSARKEYEAIEKLLQATSADKKFIEAYLLLGEVYTELKKYDQAVAALNQAVALNPDFFPNTFFNLAYIHYQNRNFENAAKNFQVFVNREDVAETSREKARDYLLRCNFIIHALNNPVDFNPVSLGDSINSKYDEYWPSLTADEEMLVFTRQVLREPTGSQSMQNKREDFYYSKKIDDTWTKASELGYPINTDMNEGAQSLSVDGRLMYFTACNRDDGYGSCDIYVSVKEGENWSAPVNLGPPINSAAWEAQPSVSPDGKTLYFVSNRAGGSGGMDIWKSEMNRQGLWSAPVNLGKLINTSGDEMSPFIHHDNQTLYFSSNGLIGMGGFDLFKSGKDEAGKWTEPINLGYPINTFYDETGLFVTASGKRAYFSSDRLEGAGKDIFNFDLHEGARPASVSYIKGIVYDAGNKRRLAAKFELIDLATKELIMESVSDIRNGEFLVTIPADRDYALNVSKPEYLFYSENFSLKGVRTIEEPFLMDIPLQRIKSGEKVVLRNIFFDFDKSELKEESFIELDRLVQFMQENPKLKIRINGHTDNIGSPEYNMKLSDQRAVSVMQYLRSKGIQYERIISRGFGSTQPVEANETPEGRARNRRTEFEVL